MIPENIFKIIVENYPLISIDFIVVKESKILLGRRVNKPAQNFYFTFGGIIKKNEKIVDAQKRIFKNELGLDLNNIPEFIGIFEHFYEDGRFENISTHYINLAYKVRIEEKPKNLPKEQHNEFKWFTLEELLESNEVHDYVKLYFK